MAENSPAPVAAMVAGAVEGAAPPPEKRGRGRPTGSRNKETLRRGANLKEAASAINSIVPDEELIKIVWQNAREPHGSADRRLLWESKFGKAPDFHNINLFGDLSGQTFVAQLSDGRPALATFEAVPGSPGKAPGP